MIRHIVRVLLAAWLALGAALLLAHTDDPLHAAVGVAELIGAVLWVIPRTRRIGAVVLLIVLATATAIHAADGAMPWPLLGYAAAIVLDLVIRV